MIGLIAHSEKADAHAVVRALVSALEERGVDFLLEKNTAALAGRESDLDVQALGIVSDLLVVMGGDGTILRVVHRLGENIRPIFGINIGSLGFLTCLGPSEISRAVDCIVQRDYLLIRRWLLMAELFQGDKLTASFHGLNDVVISRGERSQLVKLNVEIDDEVFTDYNADGLIIATPTGSTAYSLAAGGPILMPTSGAFLVTPICPHVLTNRSTVVSDSSEISVRLLVREHPVFVSTDGQDVVKMRVGDVLRVTRSSRFLPLAMLPERSFSEVLRQKLKWTGSNV